MDEILDENLTSSLWDFHWLQQNNDSNTSQSLYPHCKDAFIPKTENLMTNLPLSGYIFLTVMSLITLITVIIYLEEIHFIIKNFKITLRRKKTIWVLAFYPVFSVCGLLACFIPRSSTLVDLIANLFFATCLYNFGRLMINYLGGTKKAWDIIDSDERHVDFRTLPVCCCLLCLPTRPITGRLYTCINVQIMQVAIVRPLVHLIAAVLWTNNSYVQGELKITRVSFYITTINVISTMLAVYGLMVLRKLFLPELEERFKIGGKIASIQLCLLTSLIPGIVLGSLVANDKLPCTQLLSTKAIASIIQHASWIIMMLPFALMARYFFRRPQDATSYAHDPPIEMRDAF